MELPSIYESHDSAKNATTLLISISARRQLNELSDEIAMKLIMVTQAKEALLKALGD